MLLRDDFDKWNDTKIELLHAIQQFRIRLSRLGLLNDPSTRPEEQEEAAGGHPHSAKGGGGKDWSETIKGLLDATTLVAEDTQVNFFVYKMDGLEEFHRNIDEVNVQMFYQRCI